LPYYSLCLEGLHVYNFWLMYNIALYLYYVVIWIVMFYLSVTVVV